jgi:N utilization substance protein B
MGSRRRSRELALQALFCMDMTRDRSEEMLGRFCDHFALSDNVRPFFDLLVSGVIRRLSLIDSLIERFSKNWKLDRMACVDRNILRMAVYEILYCTDIPPKVSINEAVDIGKKYGTEDSGAFINGILDSIRIAYESNELRPDATDNECRVNTLPVNTE